MQPDFSLISKYNQAIPRYTSYPPATSFHNGYTGNDFLRSVETSNHQSPNAISLYLHIPFCPKLCLYCGCTTLISKKEDLIESYLDALIREIDLVSQRLDLTRPVTQIHWGGGTPNALTVAQIDRIMDHLRKTFNIGNETEIAIECNPAHLTEVYVNALMKMGFNRISLGIQDFNRDVLKNVHREPSLLPVQTLVDLIRQQNGKVNFDFIYGLPGQTEASFSDTIYQALQLKPDRLVTFSYAHVPWVKPHQTTLEKIGLPTPEEKLAMFGEASRIMSEEGGYTVIGLDHFALSDDELSLALKNGTLHRNFQGYCTRETTGQVYAFGMSAISQMQEAYAQNHKDIKTYITKINGQQPATEKGYVLSVEEQYIREIIQDLMCNNFLDWNATAQRLNTTAGELKKITEYTSEKMEPFLNDGLITLTDNQIAISEHGRFVIRNIAAALDPKLNGTQNCFSKSI